MDTELPPKTRSGDGYGPAPATPPQWEDLGLASWVEPTFRRVQRHWQAALSVLGFYAVVRALLFVSDDFAAHLGYGNHVSLPLTAWDGQWYLQVAQSFYPAHAPIANGHLTYSAAGFEPVFPALIRALIWLRFTPVESALIVSLTGGAVATLIVWRLGCLLADEQVGRIGAILFVVFPGMGVAWGMFYCECVGLAFAAGSLLLMLHRRWIWAGCIGALATATSPMALPLVLAALVAAVQAARRREGLGALATVVLVPTGFLAYVGYLALRYHNLLFWWHLQKQAWGASVDFGRSLLNLLWHPFLGGYQGKGWMEWIGVVAVAGAVYALARARLPALINAYCGGVFVVLFVSNSLGFKPRFLAWAFPAFIAVAILTRRRGWQQVALLFAGLLPIVFLAYALNGNYMIQP